ncbi:cache domain-containing protein [Campylobacter suis]|uniref:Double Cache domain-containing protein n=1 Tax=Campylobacter suis TaxID=2790657 RepID=A0ABN7KC03_9BACT|nr:cache domain-containing protein [Campylobacter suis]CAD7289178.1 hypothetical protein LMG8286_01690 [Campylobacter suis]
MKNKILPLIFGIVTVVVLAILSVLYLRYSEQNHINTAKAFFDYQIKQLYKNIDESKSSLQALAIILGENAAVTECFLEKDREICKKNINKIISSIQNAPAYHNLKLHLHTNDIVSLIRSWDMDRYGDELSSFRYMIYVSRQGNGTISGIERGVAGTYIRALSPVKKNDEILGTIELMSDFEAISNFFKNQGIDLFVLLDKEINFERAARDGDEIMTNYFIANLKSANLSVVPVIQKLNLQQNGFFVQGSHYLSVSPIFDASSKRIGSFVLHIDKDFSDKKILSENMFLNPLF